MSYEQFPCLIVLDKPPISVDFSNKTTSESTLSNSYAEDKPEGPAPTIINLLFFSKQ